MLFEAADSVSKSSAPVDVASRYWPAFVFMFLLSAVFGIAKLASEAKTSVAWKSFFNFWVVAYLAVLSSLMSVSTAMA